MLSVEIVCPLRKSELLLDLFSLKYFLLSNFKEFDQLFSISIKFRFLLFLVLGRHL